MAFFNRFPYHDYNDYNLDWIISTVKDCVEQWAAYHSEWNDWKEGLDQDFETLYNYVHDYFDNLNVDAEVTAVIERMYRDGRLQDLVADVMADYQTELDVLSARMDTFASLPAGSTAGNAELLDIRVGYDGTTYASAGDAVRDQVDDMHDIFNAAYNLNNLFTGATIHENEAYGSQAVSNTNYSYITLPVVSGVSYRFKSRVRYISRSGQVIEEPTDWMYVYTATATENVFVTVYNSERDYWACWYDTLDISEVPPYGEYVDAEAWKQRNGNNILQFCPRKDGYYFNGAEYSSVNYCYFVVPVTNGDSYVIRPKVRYIAKKGTQIDQSQPDGTVYTADFTGALYLTFHVAETSNWQFYHDGTPDLDVPNYFTDVYGDIPQHDALYKTSYYACGDSFTHGYFTGYMGTTTFQDQPYQGFQMTYPFYIGRRAGCCVNLLARSGMTLALESDPTTSFIGIYQKIGPDAKYVTIKFGINDAANNVPLGTINSSDNTEFYGAWNEVMTWLVNNRPETKVGIIVSNGISNAAYADATIAIAKKYGVAYLDEYYCSNCPAFFRPGPGAGVDAAVTNARNAVWKCSAGNNHPNPECHEYESSIVEHFLLSL